MKPSDMLVALRILRGATGNPEWTMPQITALLAIAASSAPISQSSLEDVLGVSGASASRIVDKLGRGRPRDPGYGLVQREEDPADRRYNVLSLTAKGRALVDQMMQGSKKGA